MTINRVYAAVSHDASTMITHCLWPPHVNQDQQPLSVGQAFLSSFFPLCRFRQVVWVSLVLAFPPPVWLGSKLKAEFLGVALVLRHRIKVALFSGVPANRRKQTVESNTRKERKGTINYFHFRECRSKTRKPKSEQNCLMNIYCSFREYRYVYIKWSVMNGDSVS